MRPYIFGLLYIVFCASLTLKAYGQTCNGSLGDPVIDMDFGSGTNPGLALPNGITNMAYVSNGCPNDGSYTIANSISDCFNGGWHFVNNDHTGNPNGYMMVINASFDPSIFFIQQTAVGALCPNTTYEFAAWITNLNVPGTCNGQLILPNITFTIETTGGTILKTYNTGDIPATNNVKWTQYGTFFTTPANSTEAIVVKMTNNAPGGCGNDIALDDITFRACGPIIQAGFGSTNGPAATSLCQGGNASYTLQATVQGNNTPAYQWQLNINGNGWADIPGEGANSIVVPFTNAVPGVYQYRVGIGNGSNISSAQCRVYSAPLTVTVNPLPVVPAFADQTICYGDQLVLSASGGATYTWTGPGISPSQQNPLVIDHVTAANAGTYTVTAVSDSGCTAVPVYAKVNILPQIIPGISNNETVCAGESTQLTASGGVYYQWEPTNGLSNGNIPNPIATPLITTTYTAHIGNGGCTDSSKSVTITVNQNPVANAGSNKVIFEGQSVKLDGSETGDNITSYYWVPTTFLDNPNSLTPIATPTSDITYKLNVTSATCGSSSSSVFVRVFEKITIPNTFTPNNDGINDYWNIDALVTYPQSSVMVYNRYGQPVYQSTGYTKPWDGTYNGKTLPEGTYYYIIDLKNGQPKIAGWVLILR